MKEETGKTFVRGTIKPLEWHKSHVKPWKDDYHTVPTGYTIRWVGEYEWKWSGAGGFGYSTSPEAAKAAAQADYEARIAAQIQTDDHADVSVAEAAKVLLGDGGMMPTSAKLAAVKAHLQRDSRVQPVAIIEAWNAALRALTEAGE